MIIYRDKTIYNRDFAIELCKRVLISQTCRCYKWFKELSYAFSPDSAVVCIPLHFVIFSFFLPTLSTLLLLLYYLSYPITNTVEG